MKKHREQIKLIASAARSAGFTVTKLGKAGETMLGDVIRVSNQNKSYLVATRKIGFFPNTKTWFKQLCNSKETSAKLLKSLGYKTIQSFYVGDLCLKDKDQFEKIVKKVKSYPVVCKPENGLRGRSISVATNQTQLREYYAHAKESEFNFLVQPVVQGNEYRLSVFEEQVFFVHNKNFYHMKGNGIDTIDELCNKRKTPPDRNYMEYVMNQRGYSFDSILDVEETLPVRVVKDDGDKILIGKDIPKSMANWAKRLCKDIGCTTIGVDVIIPEDFTDTKSYQIFEINASPAFAYIEGRYPGTRATVDKIAAHIIKKSF